MIERVVAPGYRIAAGAKTTTVTDASSKVTVRELVSRLQALDYPVDPMLVACVDVDGTHPRPVGSSPSAPRNGDRLLAAVAHAVQYGWSTSVE